MTNNPDIQLLYEMIISEDESIASIFDLLPIGISIATDASCEKIKHNSKAARFLRVDPGESFSHSASTPIKVKVLYKGRELLPENMPMQRSAWQGVELEGVELEFIWEDGVRNVGLWNTRPIRNADGIITGVLASCEDITERKRLEDELDEHRRNLEELVVERTRDIEIILLEFLKSSGTLAEQAQLLDLAHDYILVRDMENRVVYWNKGSEKGYGFAAHEVMGQLTHNFLQTRSAIPLNNILKLIMSKGHWEGELTHTCKNGQQIVVQSYQTLNRDAAGNPISILEINHDITEKKKLEAEVFKQSRLTKDILNSISDGFFSMDNEWRLTYINPVAERVCFGNKNELLGKRVWDITPNIQPFYDQYHKAKKENITVNFEAVACNAETWLEVNAYPSPDGIAVFFRDITAKRNLETEMARFDRLNIIGEMAASIGHEVRNPMTTVRGYLQMFQRRESCAEYHEQMQTMIDELDRANSIISEFLSLAKDKKIALKPTYLNAAIRKLLPLLQADAIREGKEIIAKFGNVPQIVVDENEIRQCVLNLTRNALEAVETGGLVTLSTDWNGRDTVCLAVRDNGTGIPPSVLKNLGKPFVTTKENGTGLGLPVCYRIADRNNARIEVETGAKGTSIFVMFKLMA